VISKILSFDWALWFFWIMATTLGWLLGGLILPGLALVTSGILVSIFQWLVLQGRIPRPWRWIVATSLGWMAGFLITFFALPQQLEILEGMIIGLTTGIAQWTILRGALQWSGWWIMFSIIGWTTGLTLLPGVLLTGTMAGAFTGIPLEILLRYPKPKTTPSGT
jgi:hypothetical protein